MGSVQCKCITEPFENPRRLLVEIELSHWLFSYQAFQYAKADANMAGVVS